jgi:hypothetical protein
VHKKKAIWYGGLTIEVHQLLHVVVARHGKYMKKRKEKEKGYNEFKPFFFKKWKKDQFKASGTVEMGNDDEDAF